MYGKTQQSDEKTYGTPLNHDKSPIGKFINYIESYTRSCKMRIKHIEKHRECMENLRNLMVTYENS